MDYTSSCKLRSKTIDPPQCYNACIPMLSHILALDQGTTSSRAILFDRSGAIAATAQHEFPQLYPAPGHVEHDPFDILTSQIAAAIEVLSKSGVRPADVAAIGIANQRETTLLWDRDTGKPVANAIVWQDRRTATLCRKLIDDGAEPTVRARTGLLLDPYFSGTKLAWLLGHIPGARSRAEAGKLAFGTVDSWLLWNLTGRTRHLTDRTNASRTLLYNIVEDRWDPDLLKLFNIPEAVLPEVVWSSEVVGRTHASSGLGEIPIAGIAGDQQAALFGQICTRPGQAKNTYGTGCFLLEPIGPDFRLSAHRLLTTLTCTPDRSLAYALEGSIFIGGAVVQWLRDNLQFFRESAHIESIAASVSTSAGVYFVPAFTGLGAPHWDPHASGLIIGLERSTEIAHIARAALESIAFQVADVLEAMDADTPVALTELRVDGGAAANDLLMQFQADLLGVPVRRPAILETTALGAAWLAGLAVGFWSSLEEIALHLQPDRIFTPAADAQHTRARLTRWREAVARSRNWNQSAAPPDQPATTEANS